MGEALRTDVFNWGRMEWLADGADKGASLARMTVFPGALSPAHKHQNCNEIIHLLSGRIDQRNGDAWKKMAAGDTVTIYQGATHQTRNTGAQDAALMIAYSSGVRAYEEVDF